ncbi:testis-specific protein 10-interacting protein [Ctenodactylus gundi]
MSVRRFKLLPGSPLAEQGTLGSGDVVSSQGRPKMPRSTGQRAKKDHVPQERNKTRIASAEAEDFFPPSPREPSFPFQWAWESFIAGGGALLQPSSAAVPVHQAPLLPPVVPQLRFPWRTAASLPEVLDFCQNMEAQNLQKRQQLEAWDGSPISPSKGQNQGLELFRKRGLCLPEKRPGSGSKFKEAAEWQGWGAEEAERSLEELSLLPAGGSHLEDEGFSEATAEVEEEEHSPSHRKKSGSQKGAQDCGEEAWEEEALWGQSQRSSSSSDDLQGPQRSKSRAKDPKGLWDLGKLYRQLQQKSCDPQKQPWKFLQASVQTSTQSGKAHALEDNENSHTISFPNRTFHKRQEATRNLLQAWERQQQDDRQQAVQRRAREQHVQQQVARCLAAYKPQRSQGPGAMQRKLEELRRQDRQRFAEYQAELRGIQHRVQARPFLFQQAMQTNARLAVTRRFSQVLSALGVEEEELLAEAGKGNSDTARRPRPRKPPRLRTSSGIAAFP